MVCSLCSFQTTQAQSPEKLGSILDAIMDKGDKSQEDFITMLSTLRQLSDSKDLETVINGLGKVEGSIKIMMDELDDMSDAALVVEDYGDELICYNTAEHAGEGSDLFLDAISALEDSYVILDRFTQVEDLDEARGQLLEVESLYADLKRFLTEGSAHMQLAKSELVNCGKEIEEPEGEE